MNRLRLLLLEDNRLDAELVLARLAEAGIESEAVRVETGAQFRAALEDERFDLILADYALPAFDGAAALAIARARCPEVPFIVVSGSLGEERAVEILKDGATDYILKERLERLVPSIRRALREAEERRERRRLEEELRRRAAELAAADRRKDQFLAMLAHELRNPLAATGNALQLMRQLGISETLERPMRVVERQVEHQARLVDDLLDVSRITRGRISLQREWLDLAWVVRHTVEDYRGALDAAGLTLRLELPEAALWFAGDRTRLTQVLGNLLQNAIKFTDPGGTVSVCLAVESGTEVNTETRRHGGQHTEGGGTEREGEPSPASSASVSPGSPFVSFPSVSPCLGYPRQRVIDSDSCRAVICIGDTGVGIDPAMLPHVFETFAQADRSLDRSRGGLGLGLSLVKGLIELHGGAVQAESRGLGCGAEFTITLPLEREGETGTGAKRRQGGDGGTAGDDAFSPLASLRSCPHPPVSPSPGLPVSPSRRVLVVEDNRDAAETLRDLLELSGHEVALAFSGPEGVAVARQIRPQLILCDIGLPGFDGYTVAQTIRQDPTTAAARLIALTGYGQAEDQRRAQAAGFEQHLTKPIHFAALEAILSFE